MKVLALSGLMSVLTIFACTSVNLNQPLPPKDGNYRERLSKAEKAVFLVQDKKGGHGSGFQVTLGSGKKVIITNLHVCADSPNDMKVTNFNLKGKLIPVKFIASNFITDLCALEGIDDQDSYEIADNVRKWQPVNYYGWPHDFGLTSFNANVIGLVAVDGYQPVMLLNNICVPGNSGGPVVNSDEQVVGVIEIRYPVITKNEMNYKLAGAVTMNALKAFLIDLNLYYR